MKSRRATDDACLPVLPWWRIGMVWLVIGGPAIVVVAGLATLAIAIHDPDPVLATRAGPAAGATAPAQQGRNHVTTPVRP